MAIKRFNRFISENPAIDRSINNRKEDIRNDICDHENDKQRLNLVKFIDFSLKTKTNVSNVPWDCFD